MAGAGSFLPSCGQSYTTPFGIRTRVFPVAGLPRRCSTGAPNPWTPGSAAGLARPSLAPPAPAPPAVPTRPFVVPKAAAGSSSPCWGRSWTCGTSRGGCPRSSSRACRPAAGALPTTAARGARPGRAAAGPAARRPGPPEVTTFLGCVRPAPAHSCPPARTWGRHLLPKGPSFGQAAHRDALPGQGPATVCRQDRVAKGCPGQASGRSRGRTGSLS